MRGPRAAAIAVLFWWVFWSWVGSQWLIGTGQIHGPSMNPALQQGDRFLVDRSSLSRPHPRVGEIWLFADSDDRRTAKRISVGPAFPEDRPRGGLWPEPAESTGFWLLGDNRRSSDDSRRYGVVPAGRLRGRIVWVYWPPSRFGPPEPPSEAPPTR